MESAPNARTPDTTTVERQITHRTRGRIKGHVIRLMSPPDLGQVLKPFVFLDLFDVDVSSGGFPPHPHSGIGTVTVLTEGDLRFDDPGSGKGILSYGGVEWMRAAGGVWHGKELAAGTSARVRGLQLWIALPPELENGPVESQFFEASTIPQIGPARLILGSYDSVHSPVRSPTGMNYLLVTLKAGERWRYTPPAGQEIAWLCVSKGALLASQRVEFGELALFENGTDPIDLQAGTEGEATFVIASAVPHAHDLVLGYYSVHTNRAALQRAEANIVEIGARLQLKAPHIAS